MGIRGAWTTFRKLFNSIDPLEVQSKKIGIDMFSLVYTHRTALDELLDLLKSWSSKGHTLTCIWDGTAPKDKQEIIGQRRNARESAMDTKSELEEYLEKFEGQLNEHDIKHLKTAITSLSWQGWHLTGSLKREIQEKLGEQVKHIYAPGEADDMLLKMLDDKEIDIIMTLDSDLFAMGGEHIWRLLRIRKEWIIEDIYVEQVCDKAGISLNMLQDACFLAGWDRCHLTGASYMPFEVALNRIKHYGNLNVILEKFLSKDSVEQEALDRLKIIKKESKERWVNILKRRVDGKE
jgi:5'-3' exonuclease